MKTFLKRAIKLNLIVALSMLTFACGSSDGDGVPQAVITIENAEVLALDAYYGGYSNANLPDSKSVAIGRSNAQTMLKVGALLKNLLETTDFRATTDSKSKSVETVYGACGGDMDVSYTEDISTATLTMDMHSFCEDGVTMSGTMSVVVYFTDPNDTFEATSMVITFSNTEVAESDYSILINGTAVFDFLSDTKSKLTLNQTIKDQSNSKVYSYDNYTTLEVIKEDRVEAHISGNLINPDYGMIIISTPITISGNSYDYPDSGELLIKGANGTSAVLYFLSSSTYYLECDTGGDGTYDWKSAVLYWN